MNNVDVLEIYLNNIESDLNNNKVDLYVAKIELNSIIAKSVKIHNAENSCKVDEILNRAKNLLKSVLHSIEVQQKEEHFNSNNIIF